MKNFFACLFLIIFGLLVFGLVFRGVAGNPSSEVLAESVNDAIRPFGTTTDRARFVLTRNLVEEGSFALDRAEANASSPDAGYYKGNWYLLYAPGLSILAAPFYILGSYFNLELEGAFAVTTLFSIGSLIFIFLISRKVLKMPYWASLFASLIFGFASVSLGYTSTLFQHHATTFLIISSFYGVYKYKVEQKWSFLWALYVWTAYGVAILIDYPNALLMLPVMVYFLVASIKFSKEKDRYKVKFRYALIFTSIMFIGISVLHGYYNHKHFGGWSKLSTNLPDYRQRIDQFLDQGGKEAEIEMATENKADRNPVSFFSENLFMRGAYEILIAPDKGILFFNPIFLLGILGAFYAFKRGNLESGVLLALVGVNIFLYSSWADPWGGWVYGPRYIIISTSILSIFVSYFLVQVKHKLIFKSLAYLLFAVSSAISLIGALTTLSVPPKPESIALKIKYGIPYAWDFLMAGRSNVFTFNSYFSKYFSLFDYYLIVLAIILFVTSMVLFILPRYEHDHT